MLRLDCALGGDDFAVTFYWRRLDHRRTLAATFELHTFARRHDSGCLHAHCPGSKGRPWSSLLDTAFDATADRHHNKVNSHHLGIAPLRDVSDYIL